jgi:hypothetical protein
MMLDICGRGEEWVTLILLKQRERLKRLALEGNEKGFKMNTKDKKLKIKAFINYIAKRCQKSKVKNTIRQIEDKMKPVMEIKESFIKNRYISL